MQLPSMSEYREALQHPQSAFRSLDLQKGEFELTPLGLPKLISGGFALTACATTRTSGHSSTWAIRCFHRDAPDLQGRYEHISNFLQSRNEEFFVGFSYELEGIKVGGNWYPIVRMKWVDGQPLDKFIEANLNNSSCLKDLASQIQSMSSRLNQLGMAHGDLQHGNILVRNGKLILIDYDGMYITGMPYQRSNELGQPSFQHPKRNQSYFNERIDNFSVIAIYVSLLCLATTKGTELWRDYHNGENLIFAEKDYQNPAKSSLFRKIRESREIGSDSKLRQLVDQFKEICLGDLKDIPSLDQFLKGQSPTPIDIRESDRKLLQEQPRKFPAQDIQQLLRQEGERITVFGKVDNVREYREGAKLIAIFINFGNLEKDSTKKFTVFRGSEVYKPFTIVVFQKGLESLSRIKNLKANDLKQFQGKDVIIRGMLEKVIYEHQVTPQIVLEDAYQLTPPPTPPSPQPTPPQPQVSDQKQSQEQSRKFLAQDIQQLLRQEGERITVIGRVSHVVKCTKDLDSFDAVAIDFEYLKNESTKQPKHTEYRPFTVIIFSEGLNSLSSIKNLRSRDLKKLEGKYLAITGLLERVQQGHRVRPQIILESAYQLISVSENNLPPHVLYRGWLVALRLWCRRHQGLITILGLFVVGLVITIIRT